MTATQRTKVDTQVLEAIASHILEKGYPPSFREIGEAVGLASVSSVRHHIERLREQGLVDHDPRRPRTLRLTKQATA